MRKAYLNWLMAALFSLAVTACGGGGGGGSADDPTDNRGSWDEMIWDQDNWQ